MVFNVGRCVQLLLGLGSELKKEGAALPRFGVWYVLERIFPSDVFFDVFARSGWW